MSHYNTSSAHLAAIAHDPLEEGQRAGLSEIHSGRDWRSGGQSWRGGARGDVRNLLPDLQADSLRPVLLAGAIGLFAAWVVSGLGKPTSARQTHRSQARRWTSEADQSRSGGYDRDEPRRSYRSATPGVGPEGASSPEDERLDALNP